MTPPAIRTALARLVLGTVLIGLLSASSCRTAGHGSGSDVGAAGSVSIDLP